MIGVDRKWLDWLLGKGPVPPALHSLCSASALRSLPPWWQPGKHDLALLEAVVGGRLDNEKEEGKENEDEDEDDDSRTTAEGKEQGKGKGQGFVFFVGWERLARITTFLRASAEGKKYGVDSGNDTPQGMKLAQAVVRSERRRLSALLPPKSPLLPSNVLHHVVGSFQNLGGPSSSSSSSSSSSPSPSLQQKMLADCQPTAAAAASRLSLLLAAFLPHLASPRPFVALEGVERLGRVEEHVPQERKRKGMGGGNEDDDDEDDDGRCRTLPLAVYTGLPRPLWWRGLEGEERER